MSKFVKVDLTEEECKVIAQSVEAMEQTARMFQMDGAAEQRARVVMASVRMKMNVSSTLFGKKTDSAFVHGSIPEWLKNQH